MDGRPITFDILSDDDEDAATASASASASASAALFPCSSRCRKKRRQLDHGESEGGRPPPTLVIDDDTTPQKPKILCSPSFVSETPLFAGNSFDSLKDEKRLQLDSGEGERGRPPPAHVTDADSTTQNAKSSSTPSFVAETPLSKNSSFDSAKGGKRWWQDHRRDEDGRYIPTIFIEDGITPKKRESSCIPSFVAETSLSTDHSFSSPRENGWQLGHGRGEGGRPTPTLVIDDGTTLQKPNPASTPSFVVETPLSTDHSFNSREDEKKWELDYGRGDEGGIFPRTFVIDDDTTPHKLNPMRTPSLIGDTRVSTDNFLDSSSAIVKCSLACDQLADRSPEKLSGIRPLICLDSDSESELDAHMITARKSGTHIALSRPVEDPWINISSHIVENLKCSEAEKDYSMFSVPTDGVLKNCDKNDKNLPKNDMHVTIDESKETANLEQIVMDSYPHNDSITEDVPLQTGGYNYGQENVFLESDICTKENKKGSTVDDRGKDKPKVDGKKRYLKEEKLRLLNERKRQKQQEKLEKEALKAEAAEAKKLERERQKWEKGKFAQRSIMAEIDAKVIENGSVGGNLLTRFAEKGLSFRITSNPIRGSILWKMNAPDNITELSSLGFDVPYILVVYQAEEFCGLITSESFFESVHIVQSQYPAFTVCYLTNKLMGYINKCEQIQYKNPSNAGFWRRPPVEEVLSRLTTHYSKVHSRQCIDEAEVADAVVGLTLSLATCQFRKKPTWLSGHANGSIIPKHFIDRSLIKRSAWLKALVAIPKVRPRHAVAIWKKYPTMRSLLNVYMDPNKSVHEKQFLLKDLMIEGILGKEVRRLGEFCSTRVYRILMAQNGGIRTDDVEEGADSFPC